MSAPATTVACPACREAVAVDATSRQSRRARCGCGARFDLMPPRPDGDGASLGPYRGDGGVVRLTAPPVDDDIMDLSGGRRTRYVRVFHRGPARRQRLAVGLIGGAVLGFILASVVWVMFGHSVDGGTSLLLFLGTFVAGAGPFVVLSLLGGSPGPAEVWIEDDRLHWKGQSRPLTAIEGVCLDVRDESMGPKSGAVTQHYFLAFPQPSGSAEPFMRVDHLSSEAREWLARHLDDGVALLRTP